MEQDILFKAEKVNKAFGLAKALADVDIEIRRGEIQGLIGENGSGKSTLSSIIAGIKKADSGAMVLEGEPYRPAGTIDAMDKGVAMVVQEQGTIGTISAAANIFIGKEGLFARGGALRVGKMQQAAAQALEAIGAGHIDPVKKADSFTFEDRKLMELARALHGQPKLWIIDETTTALTVAGRDILYALMRKLRDSGSAVLFISHDIEEIVEMCDSLTILRDGVLMAKLRREEFDTGAIKQLMIGREMSGHYYRKDESSDHGGQVALRLEGIFAGILKDISLTLHGGEILGVGGLSDCGMHELGKVAFGLTPPEAGWVSLQNGDEVKSAVMAVESGLAYMSKNRDRESLMLVCSIKDNTCLPSLKSLGRFGLVAPKKEKVLAGRWMEELSIKAPGVATMCNTLSGGNKQKVVLAKWLGKGSNVLILDCPTRGIDIGTKAAIYMLIERLKKDGKAILLISEELPELIGMSDRLLVLKDGRLTGEFMRSEGLTETKLIEKMI